MALIAGTPFNDFLNGTNKADTIYGLEGSDTIHGNQGDDKVVGEQESLVYSNIAGAVTIPAPITFGADSLFGDQGNDQLYGDLVSLVFKVEAGTDASQTFGGTLAAPITNTFGNDMLNGGVGDDVVVGDIDSILLSARGGMTVVAPPVSTANATLELITLNMGADTLYGDSGVDVLFGDARLMTLEAFGGTANDPTVGNQSVNSRISGITFQGGNDNIYGGSGNDQLVGDVGILEWKAQGGNSFGLADTAAGAIRGLVAADRNILTMGDDHLWGDQGADNLYGDIQLWTLTAVSGLVNGGASAQSQIFINTLNMGADELYGGSENDLIIGDIGEINILCQSGISLSTGATNTVFFQPSALTPAGLPNIFNMGDDHLWGDQGADKLYGDIQLIAIAVIGGAVNGGASANAQFIGNIFNMGADELHGGSENDQIFGDVGELNITGQGGSSLSTGANTLAFVQPASFDPDVLPNIFKMGVDQIYGDNGDDHLVGDIGILTLQANGGLNSGGNFARTQFSVEFIMGNDSLDGDNGNDAMWGDIQTLKMIGQGGVVTDTGREAVAEFGSVFTLGADTLTGGNGNDVLYGDLGTFIYDMTAGTITSTSTHIGGEAVAGSDDIFNLVLLMGSDTFLLGGAGDDLIFGDLDVLSITLKGGANNGVSTFVYAANALLTASNLTMGNDVLDGGSGNDTLYGDLRSFSAVLTPGTGVNSGAHRRYKTAIWN